MRKFNLLLAAASALTLGAGAASAQVWMPIIERQAVMEDRIDAGVASGEMSAAEARMLRADLSSLVALEGRYRFGGLSAREKLDLDRQFALLDDRVRLAERDGADANVGLASLADRKARIDASIDQGVRSGQLTTAEANALRDDFDAIAQDEAAYRADGMSLSEREDLSRKLDDLADQVRIARADSHRVYGYNRY